MAVDGGARARQAAAELGALRQDWLLLGLVAAVAVCLILGALLMAAWAPWFGLVVFAAILLIVAGTILAGIRRSSRQESLLWALAIAVERGMPLSSTLEALAYNGGGGSRRRLLALAGLLDAGAPLPAALGLVPGTLPRDATALLAVGWRSGRLAGALREAADARWLWRPVRDAVASRLAYLLVALFLMKTIVGFLLYFVTPKFEAIFNDFGVPLPAVTVGVIRASHLVFKYGGPIFALMAGVELVLPLTLPLSLGGWLDGGLPLVDRLFPSRHAAPILRAMAWVVEGQKPLSSGVAELARHYPGGWVRGRLELVVNDLDDGADCWVALAYRGLIRPADAAILEAARRAGNLPWALRETAEGSERRSIVRLQGWVTTLSTLLVLGLGVVVLLLTAGFLAPLITLIEGLIV